MALRGLDARVKLVCLAVYFIVALHARSAASLGVCASAMVTLALVTRIDVRSVCLALLPLAPILAVTVVAQVLYVQQGDVLAWLGPVAVTREALAGAAAMMVGLLCILGASMALMRCTKPDELARAVGWLLAPLRHLGVRVGGASFALSVAFGFVPVLASDFTRLKRAQQARHASFDGGVSRRLAAYARLFPPLVRSAFRRADALAESAASRCLARDVPAVALHPACFGIREAAFSAVTAVVAVAATLL